MTWSLFANYNFKTHDPGGQKAEFYITFFSPVGVISFMYRDTVSDINIFSVYGA